MATKKVIKSIDSRLGMRGKRELFSFSGVEAQNHIDEYMTELRMTKDDLDKYEESAAASRDAASDSAKAAAESEKNAADSAVESADSAVLSESWAIGGTGSRDSEDQNNSKYYAERSAESASEANISEQKAAESMNAAAGSASLAESSMNSAAGYAETAQDAAERAVSAVTGVTFWNGRSGEVVPESGDYTASMIPMDDGSTVEADLSTLIGSDAGKSARTIANEELVTQLIPENAKESMDTLKEIAAWIQSHPDDASAMNEAITALQAKVNGVIKSVSLNGTTLTITMMDGTTKTFETQDTTYTLPAATSSDLGGVKTGSNITNNSGTISLTKENVTSALGYTPPTTNTTYGNATTSAAGLMSAADKTRLNNMLSLVYPVGSIYMSVNSTSPATLFGGTWEQLKDRFLIGAGSSYAVNATGGSTTHTLTTSEMPSHTHTFTGSAVTSGNQSANHTHTFSATSGSSGAHGHTAKFISITQNKGAAGTTYENFTITNKWNTIKNEGDYDGYGYGTLTIPSAGAHTHSVSGTTGANSANHTHSVTANGTNSNTGSGNAHSIMNPYLAVYMWKRTK